MEAPHAHTPPTKKPQVTKHHPSSVDLELVKRLVVATDKKNMVAFLSKEFDCITRDLAGALACLWGGGGAAAPGEGSQGRIGHAGCGGRA